MTVIELFLYANSTNMISFGRTQKINSYKRFIPVNARTICDPDSMTKLPLFTVAPKSCL